MNKFILSSIFIFLFSIVTAISLTYFYIIPKNDPKKFHNPYIPIQQRILAAETKKRLVVGFLPYWNLKEVNQESLKNVDLLYYFGAHVKPDGSFDKTDPSWTRMSSIAPLSPNTRKGITIVNMDQNSIAKIVTDPNLQKIVIKNTVDLMISNKFSDVNIDFEYVGVPDRGMSEKFNLFLKNLKIAMTEKFPDSTLSVSVLSDSVKKIRLYDINTMSQNVDYVVVMAYDFTRTGSIVAGPVAPLFGKEKFEYDVYNTVLDFVRETNQDKILLGIPFYGYEWPTVDNKIYSFTLKSTVLGAHTSSYKNTIKTLEENGLSTNFDDYSKSNWFSYYDKETGTWRQVWFENERALGLKLDLVNQADLAGIAIWALGYEGNHQNLWNVINQKLRQP